ncbi:thioredoxin family protein [Haloparvum sedimenti]|uniref:thioredoxin family protein n=1 Tax=Haloparvum sedimenti TaxID=1678448 RepID=UPI00071E71F4|nr:thioredoxin family protein [Haloparvum sedimenti]
MSETTTADDADRPDANRPVDLSGGEELDALLADSEWSLVMFYTKGCTLCQSMHPILGTVAKVADVAVASVNPGDDLDLVADYDVRSVPTLVLFEGDEPVDRIADGFVGAERVLALIREHAPDRVPSEEAE